MIKRIVVGLDPSEYSKTAQNVAIGRAKQQGATVIGVAVADLPGIERAEAAAPAGAIHYAQKAIERHLAKAQDVCEKLLNDCEHACADAGVSFEREYHTGNPADILVDMSFSADLAPAWRAHVLPLRDNA